MTRDFYKGKVGKLHWHFISITRLSRLPQKNNLALGQKFLTVEYMIILENEPSSFRIANHQLSIWVTLLFDLPKRQYRNIWIYKSCSGLDQNYITSSIIRQKWDTISPVSENRLSKVKRIQKMIPFG